MSEPLFVVLDCASGMEYLHGMAGWDHGGISRKDLLAADFGQGASAAS